jgi:hypothetical protein
VTQHGVWATGENGGHPAPVSSEEAVADGVDAAVDSAQPAELQPVVDRVGPEAKL